MFAIIKTGSKQFTVSEGQEIFVEKLPLNEGNEYFFEKVLLVGKRNNKEDIIGTPFVHGAKVAAQIIKQGKAKKILVAKYKKRKKYRLKRGHRQFYTKLLITKIICV